jgi:DNA-binding CsgD family transcriptional regulator
MAKGIVPRSGGKYRGAVDCTSLRGENVRALIRLTNEAAEMRKAGASPRTFVLEGLCKIIDAQVAMTFDFKVLSDSRALMSNGFDVGFPSASDRAYVYDWFTDSRGVGDPTFPGMLGQQSSVVTRRREDLVSDTEWRNSAVSFELHRKVRLDDVLMSLRFYASGSNTGLVFKRERKRKGFSEEQRNLIDLFSNEYGSLIDAGEPKDLRMGAVLTLSPRERDVLALLAKGLSYVEIADVLEIRHGTVQSYVKSLYGKLDIGSKAEAAAIAVKAMLI